MDVYNDIDVAVFDALILTIQKSVLNIKLPKYQLNTQMAMAKSAKNISKDNPKHANKPKNSELSQNP